MVRGAIFDRPDESGLAVAVAAHIAPAPFSERQFQVSVLASGIRMRAEIVPEIEVPIDVGSRRGGVRVHLVRASASAVVAAKIAATGQAELTHDLVAQRFERGLLLVERVHIRYDSEHVDNRLGAETRNGGTADMMELEEQGAEGGSDPLGLAREGAGPGGIVRGEYDLGVRQCPSSSKACGWLASAFVR